MIPVVKADEPAGFEKHCRKRGKAWLTNNPGKRKDFPDYWSKFQQDLADAFDDRCGWWAMEIEDGDVDHYLSKFKYPEKAYEWDNYRYIAGTVNSSKGNLDDSVIDPFKIEEGWFEVLLPSMLLKRTDAVPEQSRAKADFTIKKLKLSTGIKVRRFRKRKYEAYKRWLDNPNTGTTFNQLEREAPLVAAAVRRWEATGQPLP